MKKNTEIIIKARGIYIKPELYIMKQWEVT